MAKLRRNDEKILWFATFYQVIYGTKKPIYTGTWWWKLAYRFSIFCGFNSSFKWVKHASSSWKPTYQYHVSYHNNISNKTKLWQAQFNSNNFMHFDTLAKHSPVNSKKYGALPFNLIQEFENRFQDFWENNILLYLWHHFQLT